MNNQDKITLVSWDGDDAPDDAVNIADLGGWVEAHKWHDYLLQQPEIFWPHYEALKAGIIESNMKLTGEQRQNEGIDPMFSDGKVGLFTWRAWGDLMAAIWNTEEGMDDSYLAYYM